MFYDEQEFFLGYDNVSLGYCCALTGPVHYERMITFNAQLDGKYIRVNIGVNMETTPEAQK